MKGKFSTGGGPGATANDKPNNNQTNGGTSASNQLEPELIKKSPWLHAWSDPVAGVNAFSSMLSLADLNDDGENKLIVTDMNQKLKVYKGTNVIYEDKLLQPPVAVQTFYDSTNKPMIPYIAIACANQIFIYHKYRPSSFFNMPKIEVDKEELNVWSQLASKSIDVNSACEMLHNLRENGVQISCQSIELLAIENTVQQEDFVDKRKARPIEQLNFITCLSSLQKSLDEEKAVTLLIAGSENKEVHVFNNQGNEIIKTIALPSVPVFLECQGQYDVDYKIIIACRDGRIHIINNGNLSEMVMDIESKPVGLCRVEKTIIVAGMNNVMHAFFMKGKKNYSVFLPAAVTNMEKMEMSRNKTMKAVLVALANCEVRLYNEKNIITTIKCDDIVTGMKFGVFGREEGSLIMSFKSGGLTVKMLQRQANLSVSTHKPGPPPEQDIPLNIPKKTKLFVELTQRERDQAADMHRMFQKDLCKLRLKTAQNYIKMLSDGMGPMSYAQGAQLRLNAMHEGIGPIFQIKLQLQNLGKKPLFDTNISLNFPENLYKMRSKQLSVPLLLPNLSYKVDLEIENVDPTGAAGLIRVFVFSKESTVPMISANISMPLSEQNMEGF